VAKAMGTKRSLIAALQALRHPKSKRSCLRPISVPVLGFMP
jgi:hypothetical protein